MTPICNSITGSACLIIMRAILFYFGSMVKNQMNSLTFLKRMGSILVTVIIDSAIAGTNLFSVTIFIAFSTSLPDQWLYTHVNS